MIVGYSFDGDTDDKTKWEQHDVYSRALTTIVSGCEQHARQAAAILQTELPPRWTLGPTFDHRILQDAHDLLAAAWQYEVQPAQGVLSLERNAGDAPDGRLGQWLRWLWQEVASWNQRPHLVRLTMTVLANQNTALGYEAEDGLSAALRERFPLVAWHKHQTIWDEDRPQRGTAERLK